MHLVKPLCVLSWSQSISSVHFSLQPYQAFCPVNETISLFHCLVLVTLFWHIFDHCLFLCFHLALDPVSELDLIRLRIYLYEFFKKMPTFTCVHTVRVSVFCILLMSDYFITTVIGSVRTLLLLDFCWV